MALTTTTLASACGLSDKQITVASATGFTASNLVLIDREVCRVSKEYVSGVTIPLDGRGLEGTVQLAHVSGTNATTGLATDFADPAPGTLGGNTYPSQVGQDVRYYSASGAITLPSPGRNMLAVLVGTTIRVMTLANPTKDMDGSILIVAGNGIAAHTVTYTAGFGNVGATADVVTFGTTQAQTVMCIAVNGFWNLLGPVGATAIANNVAGPLVA